MQGPERRGGSLWSPSRSGWRAAMDAGVAPSHSCSPGTTPGCAWTSRAQPLVGSARRHAPRAMSACCIRPNWAASIAPYVTAATGDRHHVSAPRTAVSRTGTVTRGATGDTPVCITREATSALASAGRIARLRRTAPWSRIVRRAPSASQSPTATGAFACVPALWMGVWSEMDFRAVARRSRALRLRVRLQKQTRVVPGSTR